MFIHPNFVTLIGLLMVIPFLYNLYYDRSLLECVLYFRIIYELDCFDGSIARTCNKITKYGALFDVISDNIRFILVSFVIIYKLKDRLNSLQLSFITLITLVIIYTMIKSTMNEMKSKKMRYDNDNYYKINYFESLINDFSYLQIIVLTLIKLYLLN
jgi:phosphatidylglycerophosphate synthase